MTYIDTASICHIDCTDHPSEHEDVAVEKISAVNQRNRFLPAKKILA